MGAARSRRAESGRSSWAACGLSHPLPLLLLLSCGKGGATRGEVPGEVLLVGGAAPLPPVDGSSRERRSFSARVCVGRGAWGVGVQRLVGVGAGLVRASLRAAAGRAANKARGGVRMIPQA